MAERRRLTLLQLAIAASTAVVPVLLAVLLIVAAAREADTLRPARNSDRHVSVRHVAALKTFEHAIVRRDAIASPLPSAETIVARIPQCRSEWEARGGTLSRLRRMLTSATGPAASPAARMAQQLAVVDDALLAFSSAENRRVSDAVGFDAAAWSAAVTTALTTPIETPDYPGHRFALQCADIAGAVAALARGNGRILPAFAWRGTETDRVLARWRPDQFVEVSARDVARTNPWAGVPGCVYLGAPAPGGGAEARSYYIGGGRGQDERLCARPEMRGIPDDNGDTPPIVRLPGEPAPDMAVEDPRWSVPPSLGALLRPLDPLRRPGGALYRAHTTANADTTPASGMRRHGPNRIDIDGTPVDAGFSIDLTIDPALQALAQRTASCYTGRDDVCRALGIARREDGASAIGQRLLERALVRMAAVAVIDVGTGRIEALAGAMSRCTREEYDGPGRSATCDRRLPYPIRYRPDALLNAAVFHDAMPGSTIKPVMAAAFLSDAAEGTRWLAAERADLARSATAPPAAESLRGQLARSNSVRFLERMFCADKRFAGCERPRAIQASAAAFGWNEGCASPSTACGQHDLLFGRPIAAAGDDGPDRVPALDVPYGRLLVEPAGASLASPFRLRAALAPEVARVEKCAAGRDGRRHTADDWEKCGGGLVVDVVAEGWGQGQARASALGVAGMMAALAAAANGEGDARAPHLVEALRGAGPAAAATLMAAAAPGRAATARQAPIAPEAARVILSGLSFSHRIGTARLACDQVFEARACAQMDWIAGKTGTPSFRNDDRSLSELARLCSGDPARMSRRDRDSCAPLRPYKWYAAAYRSDPDDPRWTKTIAVLTERNWYADSGRVHGAGDRGPNPAAEIAMQIAGRHAGAIAWSAR